MLCIRTRVSLQNLYELPKTIQYTSAVPYLITRALVQCKRAMYSACEFLNVSSHQMPSFRSVQKLNFGSLLRSMKTKVSLCARNLSCPTSCTQQCSETNRLEDAKKEERGRREQRKACAEMFSRHWTVMTCLGTLTLHGQNYC